jgi:hypothetical protein
MPNLFRHPTIQVSACQVSIFINLASEVLKQVQHDSFYKLIVHGLSDAKYRHFCNMRTSPYPPKAAIPNIHPSSKQVFLHGFEPRSSEPKSDVLPLHHRKILVAGTGLEPATIALKREVSIANSGQPTTKVERIGLEPITHSV